MACYLLVMGSLSAQDKVLDSLILEIKQADSTQFEVYRKITRYLFDMDVNDAIAKCDYYIEHLPQKDTSLFYWFSEDKSSLLTTIKKNEEAIRVVKVLLKRAKKENFYERQVEFAKIIGRKFIRTNQPDSANYYLILAEKIANRHKANSHLWSIANSRAMLAGYLGNQQEEADSHEQSWRLMEKYVPNSPQKGFLLYVIADYFYTHGNWEKYSFYNELLIEYFKKKRKTVPINHMPIAMHMADEDPMKPILEAKEVLHAADSLGKINTYMMTVLTLDVAYTKIEQPERAMPYLLRGEELLRGEKDYNATRLLYKSIQNNYKLQGRFRKAFEYAEKVQAMSDSIYKIDNAERIAEMDAKYGLEKKERQIVEQKLALQKQKIQRSYYQFGAILLGVIALLSGFYYQKRLKYHQKIAEQENILHDQKVIELKQQKDLEVMNAMLNGQEKERGRVAKDLHDGLGGLLSALKSHFQGVSKDFPQIEKSDKYQKVLGLVTNAGDEVRRVAHDIMPRALSLAGLQPAVEDLAESLAVHDIDCQVEIINFPQKCPETKEIMVFRIIQEMINNIKKHSGAKNVMIQIFGQQNFISLMIEDDGVGFDMEKALSKNGMGLSSVESRVAFLNGKIVWDSVKGQGTTVNIEIPIE